MDAKNIPTLSLKSFFGAPSERRHFIKSLGDALVDTGFLKLSDHGVDPNLIANAYTLAQEFFILPQEAKSQYEVLSLAGQRGFTSFGRERAVGAKLSDLKEFWHVGPELTPNHSLFAQYPPNFWPKEIPSFRDTFNKLFDSLNTCAMTLLEAAALYLEEPLETFTSIAQNGNSILRLIHYPPLDRNVTPGMLRAAPHEDINLITLLCEATASGLEVKDHQDHWHPIHTLKGQIVVDAGDMLQNLTNGFFKSTTHRVVNPENSNDRRFSMPFFVHPTPTASLNPLRSCITKTGSQPLFRNITAGAYLKERLNEIGLQGN